MELTIVEIEKISRKFKIPKKDIIYFLTNEERLLQISSLKKAFLEEPDAKNKIEILRKWQGECRNFCDFEELYVNVESDQIPETFYISWMNSTKNYKEKREIYSCTLKENGWVAGEEFVKHWINQASSLEDIREAMSHASNESEEYKSGLKKIIAIYKN